MARKNTVSKPRTPKTSMGLSFESLSRDTRIDDVEVPDHLRRRVKTGVAYIDEAFGAGEDAGLVPSTVVFFTGSSGAGKSTLGRTLAGALAARRDVVVLYNTGEESPQQVKIRCEKLGVGGFYISTHVLTADLIEHLEYLQAKHPAKQVVLVQDSLQTHNDGKWMKAGEPVTTSKTPYRSMRELLGWAKRTLGVGIVIGQVGKDGTFKGANEIKHAVDAHLELMLDDRAKSETYGMRLLTMSKNRFGGAGASQVLDMDNRGRLTSCGRAADFAATSDG